MDLSKYNLTPEQEALVREHLNTAAAKGLHVTEDNFDPRALLAVAQAPTVTFHPSMSTHRIRHSYHPLVNVFYGDQTETHIDFRATRYRHHDALGSAPTIIVDATVAPDPNHPDYHLSCTLSLTLEHLDDEHLDQLAARCQMLSELRRMERGK